MHSQAEALLRRHRQRSPGGGGAGDVCESCGRNRRSTTWNSWEALPSSPTNSTCGGTADQGDDDNDDASKGHRGGGGGIDDAVERVVRQLHAARDATLRLRGQFDGAAFSFTGSDEEDDENDEDDEDDVENEETEDCGRRVIRGDTQLLTSVGRGHKNQSACDHAAARARGCSDADDAKLDGPASMSLSPSQQQHTQQQQQQMWWPSRQLSVAQWDGEGDEEGLEEEEEQQQQQQQQQQHRRRLQQHQQLTTCEEDVISQRLNSCLQLLQGGPYQECDKCVKTLSSCDQNQLSATELLSRLTNLETMLLYLQVRFRSDLNCGRLKLLGRLKRAISCMHGTLMRRQAEQLTSQVGKLHERLDQTGDFRKHWRPVHPGGEEFRFVADPLDCVPRVEPGDEWLRGFLPSGERASLGHILADADPIVGERLGKRMAFTKRRGRSTRLHNLYTRDTYEDMLRRFQFAFMP